jgi:transposase-like protein
VDTSGQTIDFRLKTKRDAAAALRFFLKAIVTIDQSGTNAALATLHEQDL